MNNRWLEHFVCVYDHKNLTKAAQSVGVTQSTISKSIQKLEDALELKLFHRHTRDVKPTEAAEHLYKHACQCLSIESELIHKARELSHGERGKLRIGCGPLAHDLLLKPLIKTLIDKDMDIRIDVRTGNFSELKSGLDKHEYDCLFYDVGEVSQISDPSDYDVKSLVKQPISIVANEHHDIHQQGSVINKLFDYRWVLPPIPNRYIENAPEAFKSFLLSSRKPDFEVTDLPQALELAQTCDLITISVGQSKEGLKGKGLKPIKMPTVIESNIGIWRLRSRYMTPALKDLLTVLDSF